MLNTHKEKLSQIKEKNLVNNSCCCYQPKIFSEEQKQRIKQEFYKNWRTCENEMLEEKGNNITTYSRKMLFFALQEIMEETGFLAEISCDYKLKNIARFLKELKLKCPTCGEELTSHIVSLYFCCTSLANLASTEDVCFYYVQQK